MYWVSFSFITALRPEPAVWPKQWTMKAEIRQAALTGQLKNATIVLQEWKHVIG